MASGAPVEAAAGLVNAQPHEHNHGRTVLGHLATSHGSFDVPVVGGRGGEGRGWLAS